MGIVKQKIEPEPVSSGCVSIKILNLIYQNVTLVPCSRKKQPKETLLNDPVSTKPWHALAMDNIDFNGKYYLIVVDCFSKFVVVKPFKDLTSRTTINSLLDIFSDHGFPANIRCDCGYNLI